MAEEIKVSPRVYGRQMIVRSNPPSNGLSLYTVIEVILTPTFHLFPAAEQFPQFQSIFSSTVAAVVGLPMNYYEAWKRIRNIVCEILGDQPASLLNRRSDRKIKITQRSYIVIIMKTCVVCVNHLQYCCQGKLNPRSDSVSSKQTHLGSFARSDHL